MKTKIEMSDEELKLKDNYKKEYNKRIKENEQLLKTAINMFRVVVDSNLIKISRNYTAYNFSDDPKIANALLAELEKRNLIKERDEFKEYLNSVRYKRPWLGLMLKGK